MNAMYAGSEDRHPRQRSGPRTALIATVDAVDPVTDIIDSAANLRIDIVGRGADLMTVIIVSMITPTTDIATSQDP